MIKIDAPDLIGNAKVICYAVVNLAVPTGNTQHLVSGEVQGTAYGLAICQYTTGEGYYLFYCDANWNEFCRHVA